MKHYDTQVIRINKPLNDDQLLSAAQVLQSGGLVAFPTETVYGLGANALDPQAAAAIFAAKGRPADNPLIIHVARPEDIEALVIDTTDTAMKLLEHFSPGPLTLVLKRSSLVPDIITAGLDTVAVRIPAHETARRLIELAGVPVAAPSANRSGRPSPTRAWHVYEDMNGLIPYIIDDGPCEYGLESTVLDLTGTNPVILRPGAITASQIRQVTGLEVIDGTENITESQVPKAPGMKYRHYAPKAIVFVAAGDNPADRADAIRVQITQILSKSPPYLAIGVFACAQTRSLIETGSIENTCINEFSKEAHLNQQKRFENIIIYIDYAQTPEAAAASGKLFSALRKFDQIGADIIIAEALPPEGLGTAYMNRLNKAAGGGEMMGERP